MPTMYHAIESVAEQYDIPDSVMDIIYMYINRNMIKSCTDEFTNPIFIKNIKRMMRGEYKTLRDFKSFRKSINHGRLMLRLLYPQRISPLQIRPLQSKYSHDSLEKTYTINGLMYETYESYNNVRQGVPNLKVRVDVDRLFTNEMHPTMNRYYCKSKRSDMIEVIDYHHQALKDHGVIDKIPKYPKNKKNLYYIDYLMPKVSDFKRDRDH
tara:strand:+ start:1885 stop:2514 length:630 start_codon:yes stop_codon:yes gene_type:complete